MRRTGTGLLEVRDFLRVKLDDLWLPVQKSSTSVRQRSGRCWLEPFSGVEIHMEMDMEWNWSGNGAQFVKIVWIALDLGPSVDRYRTFTKHGISNTETWLYLMDCQMCAKVEGLDANTANLF